MPIHDNEYAWINRVITRVASRARIVGGKLHEDDAETLRLLGEAHGNRLMASLQASLVIADKDQLAR